MKKLENSEFIATHVHPAWRDRADYIFKYSLEGHDDREWEQMWGKKNDDNSITICCIPFFAYGLALGDVVEIDHKSVFIRLKQESGNLTIRAWTREMPADAKRPFVEAMLLYADNAEMHSDDLVAFNVSPDKFAVAHEFLVKSERNIGAIYEIANK
jgi:hypothetical protein